MSTHFPPICVDDWPTGLGGRLPLPCADASTDMATTAAPSATLPIIPWFIRDSSGRSPAGSRRPVSHKTYRDRSSPGIETFDSKRLTDDARQEHDAADDGQRLQQP